jgi:aerobic carbon-monoxide dehydrogenase medium subunit
LKAAPFGYAKPASLAMALELLARHGERAKLLAGGQSLVPTLNLRLSAPELLIDLGALGELEGVAPLGDGLRIGALTRHRDIERSALVAARAPLLAQAAPHIAHVAIRNRGTFGGSLALADPAAEWPACCLALGATLVLASARGERRVPAGQFFKALYATDLAADEILVAAEFPAPASDARSAFLELARRRSDYAIVGLAALARRAGGSLRDVRLAFLGVGATPVLARQAMAALEGSAGDAAAIAAAQRALGDELAPLADLYHSAAAKLYLARVLAGRAIAALAA